MLESKVSSSFFPALRRGDLQGWAPCPTLLLRWVQAVAFGEAGVEDAGADTQPVPAPTIPGFFLPSY